MGGIGSIGGIDSWAALVLESEGGESESENGDFSLLVFLSAESFRCCRCRRGGGGGKNTGGCCRHAKRTQVTGHRTERNRKKG